MAGLAGVRRADAFTCRPAGHLCGKDAHCCSGDCDTFGTWRCIGCGDDLTECEGRCVDTQTDPNNCGGCASDDGEVCATGEGEICNDGVCCTPCGPVECCTIDEYCVDNTVCFPIYYT